MHPLDSALATRTCVRYRPRDGRPPARRTRSPIWRVRHHGHVHAPSTRRLRTMEPGLGRDQPPRGRDQPHDRAATSPIGDQHSLRWRGSAQTDPARPSRAETMTSGSTGSDFSTPPRTTCRGPSHYVPATPRRACSAAPPSMPTDGTTCCSTHTSVRTSPDGRCRGLGRRWARTDGATRWSRTCPFRWCRRATARPGHRRKHRRAARRECAARQVGAE